VGLVGMAYSERRAMRMRVAVAAGNLPLISFELMLLSDD
jgi:hypothetical protein